MALTLGPILLAVTFFGDRLGGWLYFIPIAALVTLASVEYTQLMQGIAIETRNWSDQKGLVSPWLLVPLVLALLAAAQFGSSQVQLLVLFLSLVVTLGHGLWLYEQGQMEQSLFHWMGLWGGLLLLGWIGGHFFLLRHLGEDGWRWTMLAMVCNWTADSGAYLTGTYLAGRVLGRHQLSPRLSPKKTVEGYGGSIVAGIIAAVIMTALLDLPLGFAVLVGLVIAMVSPVGDLAISLLKRQARVKDSGKLFPAHGGALDRLDSLIWSVAIAYYLVWFLG